MTEGASATRLRPLEEWELSKLAEYNSERARGIVHTEAWKARMAELQERFTSTGFLTPQKQWWRRGHASPP